MRGIWFGWMMAVMLVSTSAVASESEETADVEEAEAVDESDGEVDDTDDGAWEFEVEQRAGFTSGYVASTPNFFGIGGMTEGMVPVKDEFSLGLRLEAQAMFGVGLDDEVSAGILAFAGFLAKGEYYFGQGSVRPVAGLGAGIYYFELIGGSASDDGDDVAVVAFAGEAPGLSPQVGVDLGSFRIATHANLLFFGSDVQPILALELSGRIR